MATTHISISELSPRVRALVDDLRDGGEIIIDSGDRPIAILRATEPGTPDRRFEPRADERKALERRTVEETIARIEARDKHCGFPAVVEEDFATDMREIIANRKPRDTSAWD
jgi:antitoxin (DNA-binding transcriptional repressor) of toxin-antitoxin stability system